MVKQDIIYRIQEFNPTATDEFLDTFQEDDLLQYLHQLSEVHRPRRHPDAPIRPASVSTTRTSPRRNSAEAGITEHCPAAKGSPERPN